MENQYEDAKSVMEQVAYIPDDIINDLEEAHEFAPEQYRDPHEGEWTRWEILDHYLRWNGIVGYTGDIGVIMEEPEVQE